MEDLEGDGRFRGMKDLEFMYMYLYNQIISWGIRKGCDVEIYGMGK